MRDLGRADRGCWSWSWFWRRLVWLAVGLFQARSLIRREFTAYFLSPIAYVVLVVFLVVTGHLFAVTFGLLTDQLAQAAPNGPCRPCSAMSASGWSFCSSRRC